MLATSKNTKIISINGGFVFNAVCDACTAEIPAEEGLKDRLEAAFAETKLQEYKVTEEDGKISIYAKGVSAHASTPAFGVNAAGVIFDCLAKAGFEDDFVEFYNSHIGTACDGSGIGLKCADEFGELTFCNGIVKTEDGVISATIDIRFPVTYSVEDMVKMCEGKLEDENGRIEIHTNYKTIVLPERVSTCRGTVQSLYRCNRRYREQTVSNRWWNLCEVLKEHHRIRTGETGRRLPHSRCRRVYTRVRG